MKPSLKVLEYRIGTKPCEDCTADAEALMKLKHPLRMQTMFVRIHPSVKADGRQALLRAEVTKLINSLITAGHQFLRTESQNDKIRCFFNDCRREISLITQ